jgi:hypothetical protein
VRDPAQPSPFNPTILTHFGRSLPIHAPPTGQVQALSVLCSTSRTTIMHGAVQSWYKATSCNLWYKDTTTSYLDPAIHLFLPPFTGSLTYSPASPITTKYSLRDCRPAHQRELHPNCYHPTDFMDYPWCLLSPRS